MAPDSTPSSPVRRRGSKRGGPPVDDAAHLHELVATPPSKEYLQRMWQKRDFATALPVEELRTSHQTTLLGNIWHLGNPILSVIVYYIIFGVILDVSRGVDNFILFLVSGVFAYRLSTSSFVGGARSISSNAGLMKSFRFPRAILPTSHIVSGLLTFGFELLIVMGVAIATGEGTSRRWLLLPVVVLVHTTFNLGGALITARLNDTFRDVQQIIPFVMRLGAYASGVMFPIRERANEAPEWVQTFIRWNPFAALLDLYRWVFLGSPVTLGEVMRLSGFSVLTLIVGFRFFVAAESQYGRG